MMEVAIDWGYLKENPFRRVRLIREEKKLSQYLTKEDFSALMVVVDDEHLRKIFIFAALTGLRRGEILNLEWNHVDFDQNLITIESSENYRVKHGKTRILPLSTEVRNLLQCVEPSDPFVSMTEDGKPYNGDYVTKAFKKYVRSADLDPALHFHNLRATFASWRAQGGATPFQLKELLGHAYVKTTEHYSRIPAEGLRNLVESVSPPPC